MCQKLSQLVGSRLSRQISYSNNSIACFFWTTLYIYGVYTMRIANVSSVVHYINQSILTGGVTP